MTCLFRRCTGHLRLALEVMAKRKEDSIDLLTYGEGEQVSIPNVSIHRIKTPAALRGVGPGISFKKIVCDLILFSTALAMVWRARREPYTLVHAVEESVFIAFVIRLLFGIPYIYDMDSSLALQLTEKWWLLRPLRPVLELCERFAIKFSTAVVPVCDALAVIAERHGSNQTHILRDVSLLNLAGYEEEASDLRSDLQIAADELICLYIGNLETYQGIDLLLESFAGAAQRHKSSRLVIIGGRPEHIEQYRERAAALGVGARVHLIGPRSVASLSGYLLQADVLLSPRVRGNNTPMKIYSYLHSGKPIVATKLPTNTQVLDASVAVLADPDPRAFSYALLQLLNDAELRSRIGQAGYALAESRYTFRVFTQRLNELYDRLGNKILPSHSPQALVEASLETVESKQH